MNDGKLSAYDFLSMFIALCFIKGVKLFNKEDLELFVKSSNRLLVDFNNLDSAYSILFWAKVIDVDDSMVSIRDDIPVRDIITLRANYYCTMASFVDEYISFVNNECNSRELKVM